jgi:hypothetical protein
MTPGEMQTPHHQHTKTPLFAPGQRNFSKPTESQLQKVRKPTHQNPKELLPANTPPTKQPASKPTGKNTPGKVESPKKKPNDRLNTIDSEKFYGRGYMKTEPDTPRESVSFFLDNMNSSMENSHLNISGFSTQTIINQMNTESSPKN